MVNRRRIETFNAPEELDALPDGAVIMLSTQDPRRGIAAQKHAGTWFVVGADPHIGQSAAEMASHAPKYNLTFSGIVLWESELELVVTVQESLARALCRAEWDHLGEPNAWNDHINDRGREHYRKLARVAMTELRLT
jgi:hypothetical protein